MAYKKIDEVFWTDPDVQRLTPNEKLLLLYLVTNPHTHYSGIYYLPKSFILEETGLQINPIEKALTTLTNGSFIYYDEARKIVWVKNMAKHQLSQGNIKNILLGIANHLEKLHKSFLIKNFLKHYDYLEIPIDNPSKWDNEPMPESVTEAVKEKEEVYSAEINKIIEILNAILTTNYKSSSQKTRDLITARLNSGYSVDDFRKVIQNKRNEWAGTEYEKFLRPSTLFGSKFEEYLQQKAVKPKERGLVI